MAEPLNINEVLSQVRKLDREDQVQLLNHILMMVKKDKKGPATTLSSISGIGCDLWGSTSEIDEYIHKEREW